MVFGRSMSAQAKFRKLLKMKKKEIKHDFRNGRMSYSDYVNAKKSLKILIRRTRPGLFGRYRVASVDAEHLNEILSSVHGVKIAAPKGTKINLYYRPFARTTALESAVMALVHGVNPPAGKIAGGKFLHSVMTEDLPKWFEAKKTEESKSKKETEPKPEKTESAGKEKELEEKQIATQEKPGTAANRYVRRVSVVKPRIRYLPPKTVSKELVEKVEKRLSEKPASKQVTQMNLEMTKAEEKKIARGKKPRRQTPGVKQVTLDEIKQVERKIKTGTLDDFGLEVKTSTVAGKKRPSRSRPKKVKGTTAGAVLEEVNTGAVKRAVKQLKITSETSELVSTAKTTRTRSGKRPTRRSSGRSGKRSGTQAKRSGKTLFDFEEKSTSVKKVTKKVTKEESISVELKKLESIARKLGVYEDYKTRIARLGAEKDPEKLKKKIDKVKSELDFARKLKKQGMDIEELRAFFGLSRRVGVKKLADYAKDLAKIKDIDRTIAYRSDLSDEEVGNIKMTLEKLTEKHGDHFYITFLKGRLHDVSGNPSEAKSFYNKSLSLLPDKRRVKKLGNYTKNVLMSYPSLNKERVVLDVVKKSGPKWLSNIKSYSDLRDKLRGYPNLVRELDNIVLGGKTDEEVRNGLKGLLQRASIIHETVSSNDLSRIDALIKQKPHPDLLIAKGNIIYKTDKDRALRYFKDMDSSGVDTSGYSGYMVSRLMYEKGDLKGALEHIQNMNTEGIDPEIQSKLNELKKEIEDKMKKHR